MGEAILRRISGGSSGNGGSDPSKIYPSGTILTDIFVFNSNWIAPKCKDQSFTVRIFGGGGGGSTRTYPAAGGGGYMNNGTFIINEGTVIPISIGIGGECSDNKAAGGTTTFGTYLSAAGGTSPDYLNGIAGNGGSGGGGSSWEKNGGRGHQFGGGGATWDSTINKYKGGRGGTYGGNGGGSGVNGKFGTNATIDGEYLYANGGVVGGIDNDFSYCGGGGGGGYGAKGGHSGYQRYGGGGGGYGKLGNGGSGGGESSGGGGAYGSGGSYLNPPMYGGGGSAGDSGSFRQKGANGICIIQYTVS